MTILTLSSQMIMCLTLFFPEQKELEETKLRKAIGDASAPTDDLMWLDTWVKDALVHTYFVSILPSQGVLMHTNFEVVSCFRTHVHMYLVRAFHLRVQWCTGSSSVRPLLFFSTNGMTNLWSANRCVTSGGKIEILSPGYSG